MGFPQGYKAPFEGVSRRHGGTQHNLGHHPAEGSMLRAGKGCWGGFEGGGGGCSAGRARRR